MSDADQVLVRRSARHVGRMVAGAVAVIALLIAALAWLFGYQEGSEHGFAGAGTAITRENRHEQNIAVGILAIAGVGVISARAAGTLAARRAVRPLQEALSVQRRFVADASHELRTPLTIVHTRAQLLLARTSPDDACHTTLAQLVEDTRVLGEVVTDLLVSAQLDDGPLPRQQVELLDLARAVVSSSAVLAPGVHLEVDGAQVTVAGAPTALRRAIACLVDNAAAHSPADGRVTVTVRAVPGHGAGRAEVAVADEGVGFPADRDRLTERFQRGPGADGSTPRFGLGLALVREIAEAHGGRLALGDRPGGGALATISLPLSPARPH